MAHHWACSIAQEQTAISLGVVGVPKFTCHDSRVEISDLLGCLALPRLALLGKASRLVQQKFISLLDNLGNLNKVSLTISADLSLLHEQGHGGIVRAPSCSSASTPSSEIGASAGRIPAKSSRFPSN